MHRPKSFISTALASMVAAMASFGKDLMAAKVSAEQFSDAMLSIRGQARRRGYRSAGNNRGMHLRMLSEAEIVEQNRDRMRPAFGPDRFIKARAAGGKMAMVRKPGKEIELRHATFAPRRPLVPVKIGAKERARHADRPDGLMHTPTPGLRSNDFKRALAAQPVAEKPKRARAKKAAA